MSRRAEHPATECLKQESQDQIYNLNNVLATVTSFKTPKKTFGGIDSSLAAHLVSVSSDVVVVLDKKGIVRDWASDNPEFVAVGCEDWIGKALVDTVTIESRVKIEQLLREAQDSVPSRWRQVNHPISGRSDLPVRYRTMRLGEDGRVIAIGRELRDIGDLQERLVRAEQQLDREFARMRVLETRYRSLFQLSNEAVVIADATTLKVVEANPAAATMLANSTKRILGRVLTDLVAPSSVEALETFLANVRGTPRAEDISVLTVAKVRMTMAATLFRQDSQAFFLVRLSPFPTGNSERASDTRSMVISTIESLPDGLVVLGEDRRILTSNPAFLELVGLTTDEQVRGEPIGRWLGRAELDVDILFASLREHGAVRHFLSVVRGEYGGQADVDLSAVQAMHDTVPRTAISIRRTQREPIGVDPQVRGLPHSMQQLTELVGRVPMRDLVRETTEIIERMCIEAALELTGDNRASAAEMLGLSRQSLYVKLRRHGMSELEDGAD